VGTGPCIAILCKTATYSSPPWKEFTDSFINSNLESKDEVAKVAVPTAFASIQCSRCHPWLWYSALPQSGRNTEIKQEPLPLKQNRLARLQRHTPILCIPRQHIPNSPAAQNVRPASVYLLIYVSSCTLVILRHLQNKRSRNGFKRYHPGDIA
jgi:hypothetical protein